jgi:hypothetical protein
MKTFQIPAELVTYGKMKDKGFKITFETGELSPEQVANIHYGSTKVGWLAFSPDPFASAELDEMENTKVEFDDTGKPPSQRLRAVLFLNWKQTPEGYKTFNDYYGAKMETLVEHFKNKLDK